MVPVPEDAKMCLVWWTGNVVLEKMKMTVRTNFEFNRKAHLI